MIRDAEKLVLITGRGLRSRSNLGRSVESNMQVEHELLTANGETHFAGLYHIPVGPDAWRKPLPRVLPLPILDRSAMTSLTGIAKGCFG